MSWCCPKPERRRGFRAAVLLALAWLLLATALPAAARIRVGVATMLPGEVFFERFGHNAIIVDDPDAGGPVSYNFGFFDMEEDGFYADFVRGRMQYRLVALPLAED